MARPQPIVVPGGLSQQRTATDVQVDVGAIVNLIEAIRNQRRQAQEQQQFQEQFGTIFQKEVPLEGPPTAPQAAAMQAGGEFPTQRETPANLQALSRLLSTTPQGRQLGTQLAIQQTLPGEKELSPFEKAFQTEAGKRIAAQRFVTPESPFAKINPESYTPKSIARFEKSGSFADLEVKPEAVRKLTGGKEPRQIETDLRKEFTGLSKDFRTVRDSYARIQASAKDPSAAGDLALIFNYMKVLDPGSVVRESEFATAQNAAGVPERIRAQYNRVLSGERLSDVTRNDFVDRAGKLFDSQNRIHQKREKTFRRIATDSKVNPDNVVIDLNAPEFEAESARTGGRIGQPIDTVSNRFNAIKQQNPNLSEEQVFQQLLQEGF